MTGVPWMHISHCHQSKSYRIKVELFPKVVLEIQLFPHAWGKLLDLCSFMLHEWVLSCGNFNQELNFDKNWLLELLGWPLESTRGWGRGCKGCDIELCKTWGCDGVFYHECGKFWILAFYDAQMVSILWDFQPKTQFWWQMTFRTP